MTDGEFLIDLADRILSTIDNRFDLEHSDVDRLREIAERRLKDETFLRGFGKQSDNLEHSLAPMLKEPKTVQCPDCKGQGVHVWRADREDGYCNVCSGTGEVPE